MTLDDYRKELEQRESRLSKLLLTDVSNWDCDTIFGDDEGKTPEQKKQEAIKQSKRLINATLRNAGLLALKGE